VKSVFPIPFDRPRTLSLKRDPRFLEIEDAIWQLVEEKPESINLLLTDVIMPGLNGRALAGRLQLRQPGLKVLYMSGYTDDAIADHGVLAAGIQLLHKPFSEENLIHKVREVLDADSVAPLLAAEPLMLTKT